MMDFIELIYFFCFALVTGTAFAFMYKSMDLMFKEMDKPKRTIHPELRGLILALRCAKLIMYI